MDSCEIKACFEKACRTLLLKDSYLFENDLNERTICHRLALYLEPYFKGYYVDCEYNREGSDPKKLDIALSDVYKMWKSKDDKKWVYEEGRVYPDIIVHKRGSNKENILVIEAKKANNAHGWIKDFAKLHSFVYGNEYQYQVGVFCLFLDSKTIGIIYFDNQKGVSCSIVSI